MSLKSNQITTAVMIWNRKRHSVQTFRIVGIDWTHSNLLMLMHPNNNPTFSSEISSWCTYPAQVEQSRPSSSSSEHWQQPGSTSEGHKHMSRLPGSGSWSPGVVPVLKRSLSLREYVLRPAGVLALSSKLFPGDGIMMSLGDKLVFKL